MGSRIFALIALIVALGAPARAQGTFIVRHHVSIFGGVSVPMGDLGSTSRRNPNAGFALFGLTGGAEYVVRPMRHVEFGAVGMATYLPRDEAAMTNAATQAGLSAAVLTGWWHVITVAGSVGVVTATSPSIELYGRGYCGFSFSKEPEVQYLSDNSWIIQSAADASALTIGVAGGARLSGLDVAIRLLSSRPEFKLTTTTSDGIVTRSSDKRAIDVYSLTVGLRIL